MRMSANFRSVFSDEVAISRVNITVDSFIIPDQVMCQRKVSLTESIYFGIMGKELMCPAETGRAGGVFRGETNGGGA